MSANVTKDAALIAALAQGMSYRRAAREIGVSARTINRKMANPEFRRQVEQARRDAVERAVRRVSTAGTRAASTMERLLTSKSDQVRFQAAQALLNFAFRWRGEAEVEERIAALEALAAEVENRR